MLVSIQKAYDFFLIMCKLTIQVRRQERGAALFNIILYVVKGGGAVYWCVLITMTSACSQGVSKLGSKIDDVQASGRGAGANNWWADIALWAFFIQFNITVDEVTTPKNTMLLCDWENFAFAGTQ